MAKIAITLKRSSIGRPVDQKATLRALGLNKVQATVEKEATPQIQGMVAKVQHLVEVKSL